MWTKLRWVILGSGLAAALTGGMVSGQQIQQGNVLDANSRVGSGGFNAPRPLRDFNAANRIMTGNVAGGMAFQGFSPIRDPNSLFLGNTTGSGLLNRGTNSGLPSNYLDNFRRDSFNLEDYRRAGTGWNGMTPYHSPWSTVLNTGAIVAGQNRLGTSQVQNPYQQLSSALAGQRTNLLSSVMESSASGSLLKVPNQVVRATTGQPFSGTVDYKLMGNPLFAGAFRQVSATEIASQVKPGLGQALAAGAEAAPAAGPAGPMPAAQLQGPVDLRVKAGPQDQRVATGRSSIRKPGTSAEATLNQVLARAAQDGEYQQAGPGQNRISPPEVGSVEPGGIAAAPPKAGGTTALARSGDIYGWMRQTSLRRGGQMPAAGAVAGGPGMPGAMGGPAGMLAEARAQGKVAGPTVMAPAEEEEAIGPLKTFVGTESSEVNRHMAYAEAAMKAGRYYRAAEGYDLARVVWPENPLPAVGRCMAFLAAGDYVSSVASLFDAIRLFDSLSGYEVDLKAFVPDLKVLDSRRADLERLLQVRDDGRLRFLLGFTEYNSGLKGLGLANMDRASQVLKEPDAGVGAVKRFVEGLRARTAGAGKQIETPGK